LGYKGNSTYLFEPENGIITSDFYNIGAPIHRSASGNKTYLYEPENGIVIPKSMDYNDNLRCHYASSLPQRFNITYQYEPENSANIMPKSISRSSRFNKTYKLERVNKKYDPFSRRSGYVPFMPIDKQKVKSNFMSSSVGEKGNNSALYYFTKPNVEIMSVPTSFRING